MGWLWGPSAAAKPSTSDDAAAQDSAATPPAQPPKPAAPSPETDTEVHKFLEEFMGEVNSMRKADQAASSSPPPTQEASTKPALSSWASKWASTSMSGRTDTTTTSSSSSPADAITDENPNGEPRLSPLAESLLPTTMNCEQAFNFAFYCQSLGGQWNYIYRYGTVRSCGEHWDDFFFCMRAKGTPAGKVKEDMIREHYRRKELAKYGPGKPNSEDVWQERTERVKPDEAFVMPVEAPRVSDSEYQQWEMERMERIRKGLREESS